MADYSAWAKAFGGGSKPKVAGYLPAPKKARFVSGAERAAEGLGETVKAESLKNSLLRGGAKPAELEYAGLDDFIAANAGKKIAKADVLAHLKEKGPLAQLQQVDQKHVGGSGPETGNELTDRWNTLPVEASVADHPVGVFDEKGAFPQTVFHRRTEQGRKRDFSNYRETLIRDPANHTNGPGFSRAEEWETGGHRPIDAHAADYWIRYHNNPDAIAVQNVQSDIGQQAARKGGDGEVNREWDEPPTPERLDNAIEILARYRDRPDLFNTEELRGALNDAYEVTAHPMVAYDEDRGTYFLLEGGAPEHPKPGVLAQNDNWKNLLARHVLLQAAESGKPITLPTGKNAYAVEGMPVDAATYFYEKDFPDRIAKIAKQYGDGSAGVEITRHGGEPPAPPKPVGPPQPYIRLLGKLLSEDDRLAAVEAAERAVKTHERIDVPPNGRNDSALFAIERLLSDLSRKLINTEPGATRAIKGKVDTLEDILSGDARYGSDAMHPELQKSAMEVLQRIHLGRERGTDYVKIADRPPQEPPAPQPRPGTHLNLTPIARRNILDRGMDIMSIAAPITAGALYGLTDDSQKRPMPQNLGNAVSY